MSFLPKISRKRKEKRKAMNFLPNLSRIGLELDGQPLGVEVALAESFFARLRGLILTGPPMPARGLLLAPCNSIHTLGMRGPIEAVFLSKELRVLKIDTPLKPWRSVSACRGAWAVLEWRAGEAAYLGLRKGAQLKQTGLAPCAIEEWFQ